MLAAEYPEKLDGFELFAVVKETGVDDEGLASFQHSAFPYSIYRDDSHALYKALGNRKIGLFSLVRLLANFSLMKRLKEKEIDGNTKGEGFKKGGLIVFGKDGEPRAMLKEETGQDLPVVDIVSTLNALRNE